MFTLRQPQRLLTGWSTVRSIPASAASSTRSFPPAVRALLVLWSADLVFLLIHLFELLHDERPGQPFSDLRLSIGTDGGYAEWFGYIKVAVLVVLMAALYRRTRDSVPLGLIVVFSVVLADDALELHESAGTALADGLSLPSLAFLEPEYLGELIFMGAEALVLVGILVLTWRRGAVPVRRAVEPLLGLIGCLAFVAVAFDAADISVPGKVGGAMRVGEDWAEMLVMSALVVFGWLAARSFRSPMSEAGQAGLRTPSGAASR